jgi:hypothetical protein
MESVSKEEREKLIGEVLSLLDGSSMSSKPEETGMAIMYTLMAWMYTNGVSPEKILAMHRAQSQTVFLWLMDRGAGG